MSLLETTIAIIIAQIPIFLINRYFFEKGFKKALDKLEDKIMRKIR